MSEFVVRTTEELVKAVHDSENEIEESHREDRLMRVLFHDDHHDVMSELEWLGALELEQLRRDFLEEKRDKNMGERFEMALSPKYLGKIHVVELGMTTEPSADGGIDGLKKDYRDILKFMTDNKIVERELSRSESGRWLDFRNPVLDEAKGKLVVVGRNRPLIDTTIEHGGKVVAVHMLKRMVFSMPMTNFHLLVQRGGGKLESERALEVLETQLNHGSGGIAPIRTTYYLATDLVQ